jgi:hypothetical protein
MRRLGLALVAVLLLLLAAVPPVAADTSPSGSNFSVSNTTCTTSGGREVCTETNVGSFSNEDGSIGPACVEVFTYSISSNGRFTVISDEFGCAASADSVSIGDDLSAAIAPTSITLEKCGRRTCTTTRTVTASMTASPSGPIGETTTRSTTTVGGCKVRTTTTDRFADLAGSLTLDGATSDATGFIDVFTSTETVHCH